MGRLFSPPWCLALGVALGFYPRFPNPALVILSAAAVASWGLVLASCLGFRSGPRRRLGVQALALGVGLVGGLALALDEAGRPQGLGPYARASGPATGLVVRGLSGRLSADARSAKAGYRLYPLDLEGLELSGPGRRASVTARGPATLLVKDGPLLLSGDEVLAQDLTLLDSGLAVGSGTSLFAQPGEAWPRPWRRALKAGWHRILDAAGGGGASSGLLVALLEGRRDGLDLAEAAAFTQAGCVAVLSLSGQHLSILAAALALLLKPLGGPRRAKAASVFAALVFVFVAGPEPALLRSLLMFALGAVALLVDSPQDGRTILGLSFILQLCLDPGEARSLSFCLSYLALAGLVLFSPRFEYLFAPLLPPLVAKAAAASCGAFLSTLPVALASFGVIYPIGLVATMASAPLVAAFLWWGLGAACLCGLAPWASPYLCLPTQVLHAALLKIMEFFAQVPGLKVPEPRAQLALSCGVVLFLAFVYALPHAHHAFPPSRALPGRPSGLRFRRSPQGLPGGRGAGHVQAPGPELPGQSAG